jgi:AcrR family transcriptional regulator
MIFAGSVLFREGGASAVTLEAVITRAGVSTGSFYARFGDMQGYFDAIHRHVLEMLSTKFEALFFRASQEDDLESTLEVLLAGAVKLVRENKEATYFFAVENSHNSIWQSEGLKFEAGLNKAVGQILSAHVPRSSTQAGKLRIGIAVRTLNALFFDQIFQQHSGSSGKKLSDKNFIHETTTMLCAYLRATPSK